jgi:hypothetical protein
MFEKSNQDLPGKHTWGRRKSGKAPSEEDEQSLASVETQSTHPTEGSPRTTQVATFSSLPATTVSSYSLKPRERRPSLPVIAPERSSRTSLRPPSHLSLRRPSLPGTTLFGIPLSRSTAGSTGQPGSSMTVSRQ